MFLVFEKLIFNGILIIQSTFNNVQLISFQITFMSCNEWMFRTSDVIEGKNIWRGKEVILLNL